MSGKEMGPRRRAGEVSYVPALNEDKKSFGQATAVCQKRKLVATASAAKNAGLILIFRYRATSSSSSSVSATAASSSSPNFPLSDFTFEKLATIDVEKEPPWNLIFGDRYLFLFGEFANRIAFIDLEVATSESEEERKEAKVQFSSFNLPERYSCQYHYEPSINTSRRKLAFLAMSFTGDGTDFNGVVVLDISKSYQKEVFPEEDAFPTISAIMDKQDEEKQNVYRSDFSKNDDGARIAYVSETRLKVCDVATKEKTFEVEVEESLTAYEACCCLFHAREVDVVVLSGGGKVRFYDVKVKTQLREFDLGSSTSSSKVQIRCLFFPRIVSESRYLLVSLYDKCITAEKKNTNHRLDVIDTVDGTVVQSTTVAPNSATPSPTEAFLSHNTMLFNEGVSGAFLLKGIAVCLWNSRKAVFLVREKSASSNRVGDVLRNEWVVLLLCSKYLA